MPVLDAAGVAEGDIVLDIGCGTAGLTRQAALQAGTGSAVGVDLAAAMVDEAAAAAARPEIVHDLLGGARWLVTAARAAGVDR